jgi:hypothetical protein
VKKITLALLFVCTLSMLLLFSSPLDELLPEFGLSDTEMENFVPATPTEIPPLIASLPSSATPFVADALLFDSFSMSGRFSGTILVDYRGKMIPEIQVSLDADFRSGAFFRFHADTEMALPSKSADVSKPFDLSVMELFADFSFGTSSFLRIGRQRGDWGTGRFWKRGNLLALGEQGRREPSLATRYSVSFSSMHHVNVWLLMPSTVVAISENLWGAAVSYEFSLSSVIMQFAGAYRYQEVSGGMVSVATAIGPVQTSLFCVLTYGFPGKPLLQYPELYYSTGIDFSWRTKGRRLFQLSGQFLAESFPNPSDGVDVEYGYFAYVQMQLYSPWEKIPGSISGQVRSRLDAFVGSWQVAINWTPLEALAIAFQVSGGWGELRRHDPWRLCAVSDRTVQCFLALYVDRQF